MRRRRTTFRQLVLQSIRESGATPLQRAVVLWRMQRDDDFRTEIEKCCWDHANLGVGFEPDAEIDPDQLAKILEVIIAFIKQLMELFAN